MKTFVLILAANNREICMHRSLRYVPHLSVTSARKMVVIRCDSSSMNMCIAIYLHIIAANIKHIVFNMPKLLSW